MRTGAIIGAISGDVGGVCFSNPSGSKIVRKKRTASPHRLAFENKALTPMTVYTQSWKILTESAKKAWRIAAAQRNVTNRLGVSRQISGYQLFVQWSSNQSGITVSSNILPPTGEIFQNLSNLAITSSVAVGIKFTFDDSMSPGFRIFSTYLGNPMRSTVPKFQRDWRRVLSTFTSTLEYDLTTDWSNIWPLPVLGQVVAVRIFPTNPRVTYRRNPQDFFATTTA